MGKGIFVTATGTDVGKTYVTVEGSGGIVCPIRWDERQKILLEDVIKALGLATLVVAGVGLGTINATVLTVEYLRVRGIEVKGVVLNQFLKIKQKAY